MCFLRRVKLLLFLLLYLYNLWNLINREWLYVVNKYDEFMNLSKTKNVVFSESKTCFKLKIYTLIHPSLEEHHFYHIKLLIFLITSVSNCYAIPVLINFHFILKFSSYCMMVLHNFTRIICKCNILLSML